jgi:dTDP-4-dehydrorhamnose 3,5-epimerase-like enzyme
MQSSSHTAPLTHYTHFQISTVIFHNFTCLQDTVLYIYWNTNPLRPTQVCGIVLQDYGCFADDPSFNWAIDILCGPKPEVKRTDNRKADVEVNLCV